MRTIVKHADKMLWGIYLLLILLCLGLMSASNQDAVSICINIALFAIVGVIFFRANRHFCEVNRAVEDLTKVEEKIAEDFAQENKFLWQSYESSSEDLFTTDSLQKKYKEFVFEMKRLEVVSDGKYSCDIEDYINRDTIDKLIGKSVLNLIPGTMTGLGILGTFIGLSFGLQQFNTGSAAEIADSIAPLMDGIKIAFHTSVYGMCFSLFFNFIYKHVLENGYEEIDRFLSHFELYVKPDSFRENEKTINVMLQQMPSAVGDRISETLKGVLDPALEKMNETMTEFANMASANQVEGVAAIVDHFIDNMNQALGDNFRQLGEIIGETCELQKQNSDYMQGILEKIGSMALNIKEINDLSGKTVESLAGYISDIEKLQQVINDNFMSVNTQLEAHHEREEVIQEYMKTMTEYDKKLVETSGQYAEDLAERVERLQNMEAQITTASKDHLEKIAGITTNCNKLLITTAKAYVEEIKSTATKSSADISKVTEEVIAGTRKQIEIMANEAQLRNNELAELAKKQMFQLQSVSNSFSDDMSKTAKALQEASAQYDEKIEGSLQRTFDKFDEGLADITLHLSGTISEVDATTERVPHVVNAAYEGMRKSFEDMKKVLDEMNEMLKRAVDGLNSEQSK